MPHKFFYPTTDADVGVVQYGTTGGASAVRIDLPVSRCQGSKWPRQMLVLSCGTSS